MLFLLYCALRDELNPQAKIVEVTIKIFMTIKFCFVKLNPSSSLEEFPTHSKPWPTKSFFFYSFKSIVHESYRCTRNFCVILFRVLLFCNNQFILMYG